MRFFYHTRRTLFLTISLCSAVGSTPLVFAETVSGGGYVVEQIIAPIQGNLTGNGYVLQQSSQVNGGLTTGASYTVAGVFGATGTPSSPSPTPTPTPTPSPTPTPITISGGGGFVYGGGTGGSNGYFVFPTASSTSVVTTASGTTSFVGSTCASRVTFSAPIDFGLATNVVEDVKKLETFLNVYEHEKLIVNGIYEKKDVDAVKRWQAKYKTFILDPMKLKKPTGTVYALSQRQIERQTTASCGVPIVVTACPYFKEYAFYGDRGEPVKKVQLFLNVVQGEKLPVSGVFGPLTRSAVKRFQLSYKKDFFSRLRAVFISGNWNEETQIKANKAIGCDTVK
jgi:hypothetical protein